jgi:hypothetical protein
MYAHVASPNANNIASIYSDASYRFLDHELVPQIPFKLLLAPPHGPHTLFSVKARTLMGCLDRSNQRTRRLRQHHLQGGLHVTGRGVGLIASVAPPGIAINFTVVKLMRSSNGVVEVDHKIFSIVWGAFDPTRSYSAGTLSLTCSNDKVVILAVSRG